MPIGLVLCLAASAGVIWYLRTTRVDAPVAAKLAADASLTGAAAVCFSPDGERLLTASDSGDMRLWDIYTGEQLGSVESGAAVLAVAFSPDGNTFAAGVVKPEGGVQVQLRDAVTMKVTGVFDAGQDMAAISYGPGGTILTLSTKGDILHWNSIGESQGVTAAGLSGFSRAAMGAFGSQILFAREDRAGVWSVPAGKELRAMDALPGPALSLALSPDESVVAAAAGGKVIVFDAGSGKARHTFQGDDAVAALSIDRDNGFLAAGSGDGITRIYNLKTGEVILRLYGFSGGEWVALTPSGYYNASAGGASLLKLTAEDREYTLEQFSEIFFRPDVVYDLIQAHSVGLAEGKAATNAAVESAVIGKATTLAKELKNPDDPPDVEILGPALLNVGTAEVTLRIRVTAGKRGAGPIAVYNRDKIAGVYSLATTMVEEKQAGENIEYTAAVPVRLKSDQDGYNVITVRAFNHSQKRESDPSNKVEIYTSWVGEKTGPALHILLVWAANYLEQPRLELTGKDAEAIKNIFTAQHKGVLYTNVTIHELNERNFTREKFLATFDELEKNVKEEDTFIFFYAGHGIVDKETGDFHLLPYDSLKTDKSRDITKLEFVTGLSRIHAKNSLIMLDACQSGEMLTMGSAFNRLLQKMERKAVIAAALGDQSAQEWSSLGHGVFTYAIIEALAGSGNLEELAEAPAGLAARDDRDPENRYVTVNSLIDYVERRVPELVDSRQIALFRNSGDVTLRAVERHITAQEALGFKMDEDSNFRIVDMNLTPGEVTITAKTEGIVTVENTEIAPKPIMAGVDVVEELKEGQYTVNIIYVDNEVGSETIMVKNGKKTALAFTYVPLPPGEVSISARSAGILTIRRKDGPATGPGISMKANSPIKRSLDDGTYTLSMNYADTVVETRDVAVSKGKNIPPVYFNHQVPNLDGFVLLRGGSFQMGSSENERNRRNNEAAHQVTVSSFFIGQKEITQREYAAVTGKNPSANRDNNLPVEQVTWIDAINYCNARSQREGLTPAYQVQGRRVTWNRAANGYRLPTEAEWEYACRAGTSSAYYTGSSISGRQANFKDSGNGRTVRGGAYAANPWGLYDMAGNVWEWCWDFSGEYTAERQQDPVGPFAPSSDEYRHVTRGGAFSNDADILRSAYRGSDKLTTANNILGFRIARSLD
ncbi:MAG: SUMF1/EgtB/PvdO family nonheme iron enzyme [Treponema sp.]|nr:SUMF1/EgtB/PvdO family nonheme iron enzyme [Treponema sp.]